jgi:hypothetical protein
MALTTIKIPTELRDRISADAKERGVTAAALLSELINDYERARRFAAIREAYANLPPDDDYWAETRDWDTLSGDGLADA